MKDYSRFWDKVSAKYHRNPIADPASYQEKLRLSQQHFKPDMNVLEFGCGTGGTAVQHAPHVAHLHAIDVSQSMLDIAHRQAQDSGVDNLTFERASIESFQAPAESYDAILGLSILHLLEDRQAAINKVFSMLKPGGLFISSTACIADRARIAKFIAPVGRLFGFPLVRVFTEHELIGDLRESGFAIETQWRPEKAMAVFVIAMKPATGSAHVASGTDTQSAVLQSQVVLPTS